MPSIGELADEARGEPSRIPADVIKPSSVQDERPNSGKICGASDQNPYLTDVSANGGTIVNAPDESALIRMRSILPCFLRGLVVKGFGRGSRDLGIPTANFQQEVVDGVNQYLVSGVYYGWAKIDPWPVMKMVMNLGWNPYFGNKSRSLEVHVLHDFGCDFYGARMSICILGFVRPEAKFGSKEDLIEAIKNDVESARMQLDTPEAEAYKTHEFFKSDGDTS